VTEDPDRADRAQAAHWNSRGGSAWVDLQDLMNGVLEPFERLLVEAARAVGGGRALDVGCGAGATTRAIARELGAAAECVGVDVSERMVAAARERARAEGVAARFVVADAETHEFDPGGFDLIASRFGVMFFDRPEAAFANLRRAAAEGAAMRLVAWRGPEENPFMTTAERAAAPFGLGIPPRAPDRPGQFGMADGDRVGRILAGAGWDRVEVAPLDVTCSFAERDLVRYFTRLGPVGQALDGVDEATFERVVETVRPAFGPYVHGDEVRFDAACWLIDARA